jgi:tetratricopeptide (TPR) repeat protein
MASYDLSEFGDKYKNKDLPRYAQNEIMRALYSKGFKSKYWQEDFPHVADLFFVKLDFIIGYEYLKEQRYDKARDAFEMALFEINRYKENLNRPRLNYEYYLYLGSIQYFLGFPDEAIKAYERGLGVILRMDPIKSGLDKLELYQLNCFYENCQEVMGPFVEKPISFLLGVRNIVFTRAFNITFDGFLFAILFWFVLSVFWIYSAKLEAYLTRSSLIYFTKLGKFLISLAAVALIADKFAIHQSLRTLLLICGLWFLSYFIAQKISRSRPQIRKTHHLLIWRHSKITCLASIALPWIMFLFYADRYLYELGRLFWIKGTYWRENEESIEFVFNSLLFWLLLAVGIYTIHFLLSFFVRKDRPGFIYSLAAVVLSAPLFYMLIPYLLAERHSWHTDGFFHLAIGLTWYLAFLGLEYFIARPLANQLTEFKRLKIVHSNKLWHLVRLSFLIYPAVLHADPSSSDFFFNHTYLLFWPAITGLVYILHLSMAKIFKDSRGKLDYSLLVSLLSMTLMVIAMVVANMYNEPYEDIPSFYIIGGIIWFCLILQYKPKRPHPLRPAGEPPKFFKYLYYNRLWGLIEWSFILLPILYGIIYSTWAGHKLASMGY